MDPGRRVLSAQPALRSAELFAAAQELLPGWVDSPVRAFRAVGGTPRFIARGKGAYVWDVDDNRYIDYLASWGPLIAGHAHPAVVDAVASTATGGTTFGAPTKREVTLAAELVSRIPSVEMVRMTSSGTEATMSAIRLARATTGREAAPSSGRRDARRTAPGRRGRRSELASGGSRGRGGVGPPCGEGSGRCLRAG